MPSFKIMNAQVIPAFNALSTLQAWLRPGLVAYTVGQHMDALRPHAVRIQAEREAMLDEAALRHPDVVAAGEPNAGEPNALAGQRVTSATPDGATIVLFKSPAAGADFKRRDAELMAASTTIAVDARLTTDHIAILDRERLPTPRALYGGAAALDTAVDFAALIALIERAHDATPEAGDA